MARPMYENKKHLQNERRIADELEFDWKCVLKKVSYKLSVDFAMCVNNEIKGWVEIKKRTINYNHSHLYIIEKLEDANFKNYIKGKSKKCVY